MNKVITIAHQKGGVGKSTIALNLAVELNQKYNLSVIDLDYQKSLTLFNENRKKLKLKPLNIINITDKSKLMEFIDNTKDLVLIDSGGFDSDLNRIALIGADIIFTPVSNSLIEIYGLEMFKKILLQLKEIKPNIYANILLNNIHPNTKNIKDICNYVEQNKDIFKLTSSIIRRRNDFSKSFEIGKNVIEINPESKASKEILSTIEYLFNTF